MLLTIGSNSVKITHQHNLLRGFAMRKLDPVTGQKVIQYINKIQKEQGRSPSQREIANELDIEQSRVCRHIRSLHDSGVLKKNSDGNIIVPEKYSQNSVSIIPIVGEIACGTPILADENFVGNINFPSDWIGSGEIVVISARGDSMSGAGIYDGDYLFIRLQSDAASGEIVAAINEDWDKGAATLKRFIKNEDGTCVLRPENDAYDDMSFDGFRIMGKLVGSYKKF
jgi:repressor LexA